MASAFVANYAVSRAGSLLYVPASSAQRPRSRVWVDRKGQETPISAPPRMYASPRLSPDGARVAVAIADQDNDVWIWDFPGGPLKRLTFDPAVAERPGW